MLSKRLTELENLEIIWKIKPPAKTAESITKIISTIKDLMQLSHRHNIEPKFITVMLWISLQIDGRCTNDKMIFKYL